MVDAADPRRPRAVRPGDVTGGDHHRGGAVGDRRAVVLAEWVDEHRLGQHLIRGLVPFQLRMRVVERRPPAAGDHVGEVLLGGLARFEQRPRLECGERDRVGPQRCDEVRIELTALHLVGRPGRRLAVAVHERGVDLAELQLDPRLVESPGAIHLDVALLDRWPRPDAVERRDEAEGRAGEVVGRAAAGEADVVLRHARALDGGCGDRHEHLDFVGVGDRPHVCALRERDDRHLTHAAPRHHLARLRLARR